MPKGLSLHIGVDKVSPYHFRQVDHLSVCENDARAMRDIAKQQGFSKVTTLLSERATIRNFYATLRSYTKLLLPGDLFLLSFSGHGGSILDWSGDEKNLRDETWYLYDEELPDDKIYELLSGIRAGVRILVLSDSCYSGTILKSSAALFSPSIFHQRRSERKNKAIMQATVRLLASAQEDQKASESKTYSAFTKALLKVWDEGRFKGNYTQFFQEIKRNTPATQQPNHLCIGPVNALYNQQKPFTI